MNSSGSYEEFWYRSSDDWRLYARIYSCEMPLGTVLCLPGLTRNCADFDKLALHLRRKYRILSVDQRGRGHSDYGDSANYKIESYVRDMFTLLDELRLDKLWLVGTSMGGIMAMMMASEQIDRFQGLVLNDIGPEIDPRGIRRLRKYIGLRPTFRNWKDAVRKIKLFSFKNFRDFSEEEWLEFAHNTCRAENGKLVLNYDKGVAEAVRRSMESAVPNNTWDLFDAVGTLPMLLVRGELSDIVSSDCVAEMQRRKPDLQICQMPERGHAPTLNEPEARAAIDRFLQGSGH